MIIQCDGTAFLFGVEFIGKRLGQWIVEDGHRFGKGDTVLFKIGSRFAWIEFEGERHGGDFVGLVGAQVLGDHDGAEEEDRGGEEVHRRVEAVAF